MRTAGRLGGTGRVWHALTVALVMVLSGQLVGTPSNAAEPGAEGAPGPAANAAGRAAYLHGDYVLPHAEHRSGSGTRAAIRKWPGRKVRYHETIPAKWQWGLDKAIAHWNSSGGGVRFVKVAARRAELRIGYGETGGADGIATIGYQHRNFVRLDPHYRNVDETDPEMRVWVGRLFTHELGHVLGFGHTSGCTLMTPVFVFGVCPLLSEDRPGYYACRWIDKPLLRRFIHAYGGSARRPSARCLIAPLPPQLEDVTFTGGQDEDRPVQIGWRVPTRSATGTKVRIRVWPATVCGDPPRSAEEFTELVGAGSWQDQTKAPGAWCYQLAVENRYGASRRPIVRLLERWAPVPGAPVIGSLTWDPGWGAYSFTWTPPYPDAQLKVMRDHLTGGCVSSYDVSGADWVDPVAGDTWLVHGSGAAAECLTFFVVTDWGTVSPGTVVHATGDPA